MDSMYSGLLEEIAKKILSDATSVEEAASIIRSALADLKSDKDKGESVKIHSVGAMDSEALSKYEQFFQAWLGLSVTRMKNPSGILIASNGQEEGIRRRRVRRLYRASRGAGEHACLEMRVHERGVQGAGGKARVPAYGERVYGNIPQVPCGRVTRNARCDSRC